MVQTAKDGTGDSHGDGVAGGGRRGGEGVRGPLKNFRAGSSSGGGRGGGRRRKGSRRVGGIGEKGGGDGDDSDSYDSGEGSSSADERSSGSQVRHLVVAKTVCHYCTYCWQLVVKLYRRII